MSRPIWRGAVNFGLVNIPVDLVTAVREKSIHFHMLSKDGSCRLRRKLYCPDTGKEYDFNQTARGIEIGPEEYALVEDRELKRLKPDKGRAIEVVQFVDVSAIDPIFYDRVYYLKPHEEAYKAYRFFVEALHDARKCAVAKFVMREKQYVAVMRAIEEGLVLHTLHYADEVQPIDDLVPAAARRTKLSQGEMAVAEQLVKAMTKPLDIDQFKDDYREQVQDLIDAKVSGKKLVHVAYEESEPAVKPKSLIEALRRSLNSTAGGSNGRRNHPKPIPTVSRVHRRPKRAMRRPRRRRQPA